MAVDILKDQSTIKRSDQRKRKPVILAVINDACTGCAGSPACVDYCPIANCMIWVDDEEHPPFGRIEVDSLLCIGCKLCTSKHVRYIWPSIIHFLICNKKGRLGYDSSRPSNIA